MCEPSATKRRMNWAGEISILRRATPHSNNIATLPHIVRDMAQAAQPADAQLQQIDPDLISNDGDRVASQL